MIRKAVIPAAGFGTRMLPAAKSVPKEMLPVLDKPVIQYVVEELVDAGMSDICLVVSGDKKAVEDHFDRSAELERRLEEKGRGDWLQSVTRLREAASLFSVRQHEPRGLGHAVLQAKRHVGHEPFLCLLGDTIFSGDPSPTRQLLDAHERLGGSVIGLERVGRDKVSKYGIAGGNMLDEATMRIDTLIEKPAENDAPSDLAIAARYALSPTLFSLLEATKPGTGGEIQLTDALRELCRREPVFGVVLEAQRHDIGDPIEWLRTNLIYAARDATLWDALRPTLDALG